MSSSRRSPRARSAAREAGAHAPADVRPSRRTPATEQQVSYSPRTAMAILPRFGMRQSHTPPSMEDYAEPSTPPTRALYACPNGATTQRARASSTWACPPSSAPRRGDRHVRDRECDGRARVRAWHRRPWSCACAIFPKSKRPAASAGRARSYGNATDSPASASVGRGALRIRARCAMGVGS